MLGLPKDHSLFGSSMWHKMMKQKNLDHTCLKKNCWEDVQVAANKSVCS